MNDRIPSIGELPKDRDQLNISGRSKKGSAKVIGFFVLIALFIVVIALVFAFNVATKEEDILEVAEVPEVQNYDAGAVESAIDEPDNFFVTVKKQLEEKKERERQIEQRKLEAVENEPPPITLPPEPEPAQPEPQPTLSRSGQSQSRSNDVITPRDRKKQGGVLVTLSNASSTQDANNQTQFDDRLNSLAFADGVAQRRRRGSLDFLIMHGSTIPCAIYTQIISDYEGLITCRVTQDVYSTNGTVLLVERGSLVSGRQEVELEPGKARIFTSWTDIQTPLGVSITINSLGTGSLGATGHEAWVDKHFRERFGGAILLSFLDDALAAATENSDAQFDNSTDNASEIAEIALESSIDIKPTGYAYIGQRINILVARDIDMSTVYRLEGE